MREDQDRARFRCNPFTDKLGGATERAIVKRNEEGEEAIRELGSKKCSILVPIEKLFAGIAVEPEALVKAARAPAIDVGGQVRPHGAEVALHAVVQPHDRAALHLDDVDQPMTSTSKRRPTDSVITVASPTTIGANFTGAR